MTSERMRTEAAAAIIADIVSKTEPYRRNDATP
jgi:hypothetical protein